MLIIIGKTSLALLIFFLLYHLILSKDKLFTRNRFYLLGTTILSFIFPWITIPVIDAVSTYSFSITYIVNSGMDAHKNTMPQIHSISWIQVLTILYFAGTTFFLFKSLVSYFQVFRIVRDSLTLPLNKLKIVVSPFTLSPFSFFGWIVVPNHIHQNHPSYEKMVQHEMVHCRQYHSVDLLLAEILIILQWFNPFAWLLRKSISENLEYLVDEEILKKGTDAKDYQYSLLSFSMVRLKPNVANNFSTNLLKKRIVMMNKIKYSGNYFFHNLLIPLVMIFTLVLTASFRKQQPSESKPENIRAVRYGEALNVTSTPEKERTSIPKTADLRPLSGRSEIVESLELNNISNKEGQNIFLKYIAQNIRFPQIAAENNLSGVVKVLITFNQGNIQLRDFANEPGINELDEIVVVGYGNQNKNQTPSDNSEREFFRREVERVIKSFDDIPKDLIGKSFGVSVKFQIHGTDVVGYGNDSEKVILDENVTILESADKGENSEPFYILNNEKIISKAEMEGIEPRSIESIYAVKAKKVEHKKLGTINGSVVIIKTK